MPQKIVSGFAEELKLHYVIESTECTDCANIDLGNKLSDL